MNRAPRIMYVDQGQQSPASGPGSTEMASLATKYDQDADPPTLAYLGHAYPGTAGSVAQWRIQKLVFGGDGDVTITWADGNANFDNIWDDRASLSYT